LTTIGSIRPNVSRVRLFPSIIVLVVAAACTNLPTAAVNYGSGTRFVPTVADALDDVGLGAAVAVDSQGLPYLTYFGFIPQLAPGQLPPQRPIGAPFLPAVLLATANGDGVFTRGAIAETKPNPAPNGITSPFRPVDIDAYDITPRNTNATAVVVGTDGTIHAAWTQNDGVWYGTASATPDTNAEIEQVEKSDGVIAVAGPIGRPSIALDSAGNPLISYAETTGHGTDVRVATKTADGKKWTTTTVFTVPPCSCPPPGPAPISVVGNIAVVGFLDNADSVIRVGTFNGSKWVPSTIPGASDMEGLSMAIAGDQSVAAFYSGGSVNIVGGNEQPTAVASANLSTPSATPPAIGATPAASGSVSASASTSLAFGGGTPGPTGAGVSTSPALSATTPPPGGSASVSGSAAASAAATASGSAGPSGSASPSAAPSISGPAAKPIKPGKGNLSPTTGLVTDSKGNLYLTWQDAAGVHLASGSDPTALNEAPTEGTDGGVTPAVAVGSNGNVYVTWYDPVNQNLMLGTQGDLTDVLLANPSPSPTMSLASSSGPACGSSGKELLDITAESLAFNTNCLVAFAGQAATITFDNKDTGTQHDVSIYPSPDELTPDKALLFTGDKPNSGGTSTYPVPPIDPGSYYFQCDFHPTTMTGTFVALKKGG
jgi:plastocyanin